MNITHKYTRTIVTAVASVLVVIATIGAWVYFQPISRAADLSKFDPGNIMSDSVMSDKSTMSVQQIQSFLNSKNACNNTNTHMAAWYPHLQYTIRDGRFVCMAQDTFNGESAAQIIWQAAQDYSINPQVLIVLLEKEQGLVSDTWPNHVQYRTATGFGCPDTAPCESQYFGLKNQIRLAASMFRTVLNGGWSNYPVGQTYVQYHPNAACGGSIVNIQNRATSALYRYTPYQPNQSALNAGYGTGDSCSAYGNRNFYALFTDWFGNTLAHRWSPLVDPRFMTVKEDMFKYNVETNLPDSLQLHRGQEIIFESKTKLTDGTTCLRTRVDTQANNPLCISQSRLSELTIRYENLSNKARAIDQYTCPVDMRRSEIRCDEHSIGVDQQFQPVAKTNVRGVDYYIPKGQSTSSFNTLGIRADRTRSSHQYTDIEPVYMKTNRMTNMISHIDSPTLDIPLEQDTIVRLSQKVTVNNTTYYRTNDDTNQNIDRVILGSRLGPLFDPFLLPRDLRTANVAVSENIITREACASVSRGSVLSFNSKTRVGNVLYFRTSNMTSIDSPCAIRADSLREL